MIEMIIVYLSWWENEFNGFSAEEVGEVLTALKDYVQSGTEPAPDYFRDRAVKNAFLSCLKTIKRDIGKT